jgi:hypothetical protein
MIRRQLNGHNLDHRQVFSMSGFILYYAGNLSNEVEVTLRLTVSQSVSQSVCLDVGYPCGTCDQILLPVGMLLSETCGLVSVGRPLWREDGSIICSAITQWSESLRTRNHTLLSHLRLPHPGGPGTRIYIPQEQSGPIKPPGHWVPFTSPLATRRATSLDFVVM